MSKIDLAEGQVWRDDVGALFRIVSFDDEWVYTCHHKAPKKAKGSYEVPRAWFARPGWTLVSK